MSINIINQINQHHNSKYFHYTEGFPFKFFKNYKHKEGEVPPIILILVVIVF